MPFSQLSTVSPICLAFDCVVILSSCWNSHTFTLYIENTLIALLTTHWLRQKASWNSGKAYRKVYTTENGRTSVFKVTNNTTKTLGEEKIYNHCGERANNFKSDMVNLSCIYTRHNISLYVRTQMCYLTHADSKSTAQAF